MWIHPIRVLFREDIVISNIVWHMSGLDKNSIVDDLYYQLYGEHQTKEGQALERLSAVAFKLLEEARKSAVRSAGESKIQWNGLSGRRITWRR